jgi:Fe-S oxidoreductase/nitrate reductase gamma subunit
MIERINFWGIPEGLHALVIIITYVVLPLCALVMLARLYLRARLWWRVGRREPCWDHLGVRFQRLVKYAIGQVKVWRQAYPGLMHFGIAWGFFVFFLGTALATIDADFVKFLRGPIYLGYKIPLDVFTAVALVGLVMAGYRRFVRRPDRLTLTSPFALTLVLIFCIVLTGLLTESLRLAAVARQPDLQPGWRPSLAWFTPVGWVVGQVWLGLGWSVAGLKQVHLGMWLVHAGLAAVFLVTLPIGPLLHVITAPLNIFFSPIDRPRGRLLPAVARNGDSTGVGKLSDFTWRQLMQGDACTECGRCQDACPAHLAGQSLSPKRVILDIKDHLTVVGRARGGNGSGSAGVSPATGLVSDEVTWACTTCRACVTECPVLIEHVDAIVDMRRFLLTQQRADSQLTAALGHLRRYGNSFGKSDKQRARWTTGLDFKVKDIRKQPARTLWFVGDYASYSPALTEITQATARVFQRVGLDFGLLYDAERNAGNDLRRAGEEGLFELLAQKNNAALEKCEFEEIVTTDPHSYNTLKNEYSWGKRPVAIRHYSEVLDQAIREGRLSPSRKLGYTVTYHDPCYLGRYNDLYDPPRRVLAALGCQLVEMPRNRDRALCCGAGGGRIWMEEGKVKERPAENRIREAAALAGIQYFVVACPKDLTMYRDAVKTVGLEGKLVVKDLIELVEEALPPASGSAGVSPATVEGSAGVPPAMVEVESPASAGAAHPRGLKPAAAGPAGTDGSTTHV